jgi:hypothetical protein
LEAGKMNAPKEFAVHFVGFRGEEYWSAVRIWGKPDFFHLWWDKRAAREIIEGDTVIFPKHASMLISEYNSPDLRGLP